MAKRKKQNNVFLLSWDCNGLESVLDLTTVERLREEEEKNRIWAVLSDPDARDPGDQTGSALNRTVQSILLRARVNSQRYYEVYTIQTDPNITERDMWEMFEQNPQYAADLIRERGSKLYSDRATKKPVIA